MGENFSDWATAPATFFSQVFHGLIQGVQLWNAIQNSPIATLLYQACRHQPREMVGQGRSRNAKDTPNIPNGAAVGSASHQMAENPKARAMAKLSEPLCRKFQFHAESIMAFDNICKFLEYSKYSV